MTPQSLPSYARSVPVSVGRCAAWLHPGDRDHGVLLVGPMGFEALCTRLSWQILGDMIAARGLPTLRFEYPGDGDALDVAPDTGQFKAALDAIRDAVAWMQAELSVKSISVVGLRLGTLLALEALQDGPPIGKLVLMAPVTSGRAFIRQQKMASQIIAELRPGQDAGPGEINLCGFVTRQQDVDTISGTTVRSAPKARELLLLLEPDRALPEGLIEGRGDTGHSVAPFEGYGRLMLPPTESVTPYSDFDGVANWLGGCVFTAAAHPKLCESVLKGEGFTETRFRFGPDGRLAGVLCQPDKMSTERPCVHLLNAGANCHIGWARMSVEHARRLAGDGITSFRYDFSGVGDSAWFAEGPRPYIYAPLHIEDALHAVEAMALRGYREHVLAGLCAGGYVAFHAASWNDSICASVAANAIRLVWHPHDNLDALTQEMIQPSAVYKSKALSSTEWKRLLQGEIGLQKVLKVSARLAGKVARRIAANIGLEPAISEDSRFVRGVLEQVSKRGARQAFIHAERDQSRDESERHFGSGARFAETVPGVSLIDIAGADHELTPQAARDRFYDVIRAMVP